MFNTNIFWIYQNCVYRINHKDYTINVNFLIQFKKENNIYCLD